MLVKSTAGIPEAASTDSSKTDWAEALQRRVAECLEMFQKQPATPASAYAFECDLKAAFDEAGRTILEQTFNGMESEDKAQVAPKVRWQGATYRINKKTPAHLATTFGPIVLRSFLYLHEEAGEPGLHPLLVRLGIVAQTATARLAERVAHAAVDFSQREVRRWLETEHGVRWSNDRLRRVLRTFRGTVVAFRAEAQCQRLLEWLEQAVKSRGRNRPVLAVGRDGVMVPLRHGGYQEASTATLSVYDRRRKRLGTVYLGQMPEKYQKTLSREVTALVNAVLQDWTGAVPRLVYVTDKGQAQEDYYRQVLRPMRHPRHPEQKLEWEWVLDFWHVCSYVGKLQEALFGEKGQRWFRRMRRWLRDRKQGVTNILRSASQHFGEREDAMTAAARREFGKAYRYLRRHSRWMDYAGYARRGLPIGSGVTEAACKTVFAARMKRSGMRWHRESGQVIVDLRVLHLSGIWEAVVRRDLASRKMPEGVSCPRRKAQLATNAA
jgi:hypothetical protein